MVQTDHRRAVGCYPREKIIAGGSLFKGFQVSKSVLKGKDVRLRRGKGADARDCAGRFMRLDAKDNQVNRADIGRESASAQCDRSRASIAFNYQPFLRYQGRPFGPSVNENNIVS